MLRKLSFAIVGAVLMSGAAVAAQSEFDHMQGDTGPVIGRGVPAAAGASSGTGQTGAVSAASQFDHMSGNTGPVIGAGRAAPREWYGATGRAFPQSARDD